MSRPKHDPLPRIEPCDFSKLPKPPDYPESALQWFSPPVTTPPSTAVSSSALHSAIQEAYKKHSAELAAIEDRENKFLLLILAVYGAGATASTTIDLRGNGYIALVFGSLVVLAGVLGVHTVNEAHDLREAVRDLLVRCELVMGFYTPGLFLKDLPLYQVAERNFSFKGRNRRVFGWIVVGVGGALLMALLWINYCQGPLKKA